MKKPNTTFAMILFTLACFGLSPMARAVSPPPDGGYANYNTAEGDGALFNLTTGHSNTAIGFDTLYYNTTGRSNTATGINALFNNITGYNNTGIGDAALYSNTNGIFNTASGYEALLNNVDGSYNTANGAYALLHNTTINRISGMFNTATGYAALNQNTTGSNNTASGYQALFSNTAGIQNVAIGLNALYSNTGGNSNTANGVSALYRNTTGSNNIAIGTSAGSNLTTGSNNIDIGNSGVGGESSTIRIGTVGTHTKAFVAGISGSAIAGTAVVVNSNGRLGVAASSARFKDEIKPMDKASEAILALKPVTFHYKKELDPEGIPQFGLIAEEVDKVAPDVVARDADGKVYTVRYEAVNAMLLNEFLKEHRKVEEQQATIAQLKKEMETVVARLQEHDSKIQKVTAQIEVSRPRQQVVVNNR